MARLVYTAPPPPLEKVHARGYYKTTRQGADVIRHYPRWRSPRNPNPTADALARWGTTYANNNRQWENLIMTWWKNGNTGMPKSAWATCAASAPLVTYQGHTKTITAPRFFLYYNRLYLNFLGLPPFTASPFYFWLPWPPTLPWTRPPNITIYNAASDPAYPGYLGIITNDFPSGTYNTPGFFLAFPRDPATGWPHYYAISWAFGGSYPPSQLIWWSSLLGIPKPRPGTLARIGGFQMDAIRSTPSNTTWADLPFPPMF
jgi:hypothetical protein